MRKNTPFYVSIFLIRDTNLRHDGTATLIGFQPGHEPAAIIDARFVGNTLSRQLAALARTMGIKVPTQPAYVQLGAATGAHIQARQRQQFAGQAGTAFPANQTHAQGFPWARKA